MTGSWPARAAGALPSHWFSICLVLLCSFPHAFAQDPALSRQSLSDGAVEVSIGIDRPDAQIADPISLRIQVDAPEGSSITFPVVSDTIGKFAVIDSQTVRDVPVQGVAGRRRWTATFGLESYQSGDWKIPSLEVLYRLPDQAEEAGSPRDGSLKSEPIPIRISSVLEESDQPTQFRDIKDAAEIPSAMESSSNQAGWLVGGVLLSLLVVSTLLWTRRGKPPQPARWALAEVDKIESRYDEKAVDVANAYSRLSTVLRQYLEAEMAFPASSLSSEELIDRLSRSRCPDSAMHRLQQFVIESDELKFSGRPSTGQAMDGSPFDSVRTIIRATSGVAPQPSEQEQS